MPPRFTSMLTRRVCCLTAFFSIVCVSNADAQSPPELAESYPIAFSSAALHPQAPRIGEKAEELGSAAAIYQYLHNEFDYLPYYGLRSGSINTYWRRGGNDVDLATLLIAMLRSQGVPSRFAEGTIRVDDSTFASWMGATSRAEAVIILENNGIDVDDSQSGFVSLRHVWVEALIAVTNYRGLAGPAAVSCSNAQESEECKWLPLDVSFKQHSIVLPAVDGLPEVLSFDYGRLYNAIQLDDEEYKNRNPAEILERKILADHAGNASADVTGSKSIVPVTGSILPASLPYEVVSTTQRYASVAAHDNLSNALACGTSELDWTRCINMTLRVNGVRPVSQYALPLFLAATRPTWIYTEAYNAGCTHLYCDHIYIRDEHGPTMAVFDTWRDGFGQQYAVDVTVNTSPTLPAGHEPSFTRILSNTKQQALVVAGVEANATQILYAAQDLLTSASQIVKAANGSYYIDVDGNGIANAPPDTPISFSLPMWELLSVAARQYAKDVFEKLERIGALTHTRTDGVFLLGFTSAESETDVLGEAPFAVAPSGLLVDVKGSFAGTPYRYEPALVKYGQVVKFQGHALSALEHELWQKLTGFDAISTVRGFQKAAKRGIPLVTVSSAADLPNLYSQTGFIDASVLHGVGGFDRDLTSTTFRDLVHERPYYFFSGSLPDCLTTTVPNTLPDWFVTFRKTTDAETSLLHKQVVQYYDWNYSTSYDGHPANFNWPLDLYCIDFFMSYLATLSDDMQVQGDPLVHDYGFQGSPSEAIESLKAQYAFLKLAVDSSGLLAPYLDHEQGFRPSDFVYRIGRDEPSSGVVPASNIRPVRDVFYDGLSFDSTAITIPARLVVEPAGSFFLLTEFSEANGAFGSTFLISTPYMSAGGGYVTGDDAIDETITNPATQTETVHYDNPSHTDQVLNWLSNNDAEKCSCTGDPVSTATGNMFHDETDFTIKGRPFDFEFTRTYNSRSSRLIAAVEGRSLANGTTTTKLEEVFWPLGPGWTHSYAMLLISNDFGLSPNDSSESGHSDGRVSSITFVDARGGEVNFKVHGAFSSGTTCAPSSTNCVAEKPTGFFANLSNPTSANPRLELPDGTTYRFVEYRPMSLPDGFAVLQSIDDGFGNQMSVNFGTTYGSGNYASRTQTVTDAAGHTITLQHSGGRLRSASDWTGRSWSFGYDGVGQNQRLASVTNPLGKTTSYSYARDAYVPGQADRFQLTRVDFPARSTSTGTLARNLSFGFYENGRAFSTSDALGATEFYEYDLFRRETTVTNPLGFPRTHINDARGALETFSDEDGNLLRFKNTPDNLRYSKCDAYGRETVYSYASDQSLGTAANRDGNITLERNVLGGTVQSDYDVFVTTGGSVPLRLTQETNRNNATKIYDYFTSALFTGQVRGKLSTVSCSAPGTAATTLQDFRYYSDGVVSDQLDYYAASSTSQSTFSYDAPVHLNMTSRTRTDVGTGAAMNWSYLYDNLGRLTRETRELGSPPIAHPANVLHISTSYGYDLLDRRTSEVRPDGTTIYTDYDEDGNPWRERASYFDFTTRNLVTREFDAAGQMTSATNALGNRTTYSYDAMGHLLGVTDPNNHTKQFKYDARGNLIEALDPNGNLRATAYDAAGRVESSTDGNGLTTRFVRDALGRVTETTSPMGFRTGQSYDPQGNVTAVKDPTLLAGNPNGNADGNTVTNTYDFLDRLKSAKDASNGTTQFEYDRQGNRTAVIDAKGHRTSFQFNALDELLSTTDPLLRTTTLQYDRIGNLASMTDRHGNVSNYRYDVANHLASVDFLATGTGSDEVRAYDVHGNLGSIGNASVTYTYEYDNLDRVIRRTDSRSGKSLTWEYDAAGNVIKRTGYEGDVTAYTYDSGNRLVATSNPDFVSASYHYDGGGRLIDRILSNGARSAFAYDDDGRLTKRGEFSGANASVHSEAYCYDANGNRTLTTFDPTASCANPGSAYHSYGYDKLNRITFEGAPSGPVTSLVYDAVGNVSSGFDADTGAWEYDYDDANRLLRTRNGFSHAIVYQYVYDENGNRTEKRDAAGNVLVRYTYDSKNQLVQLQSGATTTRYEYDPYGYRISQETNGEKTLYYLDGEHVESIYDSRGKPKATFLRGAVIDEIIAAYYYDGQGHKTFYTYFNDSVGSVTALADHTGVVRQTYSYSPFGRDRSGTGSTPNTFKYTGREQDASGLYYYRARYYDPETRRFLTEDPLGLRGGINYYVYAQNNPLKYNDPLGLWFGYGGYESSAGAGLGGSHQQIVSGDGRYVITTEAVGGHAGIDYSTSLVFGVSTASAPPDVAGESLITGFSLSVPGTGAAVGVDFVTGRQRDGTQYYNFEVAGGFGGGLTPGNIHGYGGSTTVVTAGELGRSIVGTAGAGDKPPGGAKPDISGESDPYAKQSLMR